MPYVAGQSPDMSVTTKPTLITAMARHMKKTKAKPNKKAPLGEGGRFAALKQSLAKEKGVTNPGALAAAIGRRKYGAKKFTSLSIHGT